MGTLVKKVISHLASEKPQTGGLAALLLGKNIQSLPWIYSDANNIVGILYRKRRDAAFGKVSPALFSRATVGPHIRNSSPFNY